MKKILLLAFVCFNQVLLAQFTQVQVKFAANIFVYDVPVNGVFSNDPTFDQILTNNNVSIVEPLVPNFQFSDEHTMALIYCPDATVSNLINQLNAYSTAIKKNTITSQNYFVADELYLGLTNSSDGVYVSTIGNVVVTNNASLNTLFQTYNVDKYENDVIRCTCNITDLKNALDGLTSVVLSTNYVSYVILLGNQAFDKSNSSVFPNPFLDKINIHTDAVISEYNLVDFAGKIIVSTPSKVELDYKTQELNSGFYILNLTFENGEKANYKLIKK